MSSNPEVLQLSANAYRSELTDIQSPPETVSDADYASLIKQANEKKLYCLAKLAERESADQMFRAKFRSCIVANRGKNIEPILACANGQQYTRETFFALADTSVHLEFLLRVNITPELYLKILNVLQRYPHLAELIVAWNIILSDNVTATVIEEKLQDTVTIYKYLDTNYPRTGIARMQAIGERLKTSQIPPTLTTLQVVVEQLKEWGVIRAAEVYAYTYRGHELWDSALEEKMQRLNIHDDPENIEDEAIVKLVAGSVVWKRTDKKGAALDADDIAMLSLAKNAGKDPKERAAAINIVRVTLEAHVTPAGYPQNRDTSFDKTGLIAEYDCLKEIFAQYGDQAKTLYEPLAQCIRVSAQCKNRFNQTYIKNACDWILQGNPGTAQIGGILLNKSLRNYTPEQLIQIKLIEDTDKSTIDILLFYLLKFDFPDAQEVTLALEVAEHLGWAGILMLASLHLYIIIDPNKRIDMVKSLLFGSQTMETRKAQVEAVTG